MSIEDIVEICRGKKSVADDKEIPEMIKLREQGWKLYRIDLNCEQVDEKYGVFRIISKEIDMDSDKPNFVAMAGLSENSFCGSTNIIINNIEHLLDKYRAMYIICWNKEKIDPIKKEALGTINPLKEEYQKAHPDFNINSIEYRTYCYKGEIELYNELGSIIDKILRCPQLNLKNVHLLGKSMGGGIALHTVSKSDIYTKLFLAVPAGCQFSLPLEKLGERLNHFRCIVGWNDNDVEMLSGLVSTENPPYYKTEFRKLKEKYPEFSFEQHMFKNGNGHEINSKLIEIIGRDL